VIQRIDYIVEECPMAAGNRHLRYKETLNELEVRTPGTKSTFYLGFLENMLPVLDDVADEERALVGSCGRCGSPSSADVCAFCKLVERVGTGGSS
jgi:uncharacterized protein (TIGR00269 family)